MGVICAFLAGILALGATLDASSATQGEVYARDFPDPSVIHAGNAWYAFSTQTAWEKSGAFPVLRSTDLVHWDYVADAMTHQPAWGRGDWWAPSVVERAGTFYMYYTGLAFAKYHCIAVATASSPEGPYTDRGPIGCGDAFGQGYIDPAVLLDGDAGYVYFSVDDPHHSISVMPLTPDLLHPAGPRLEVFSVSEAWEHGPGWTTVEGPFPVARNGRVYLFYSGNDWRADYSMGYAVGAGPLGPFTKSPDLLLSGGSHRGPGGGSLFQGPGGGWEVAYHAWTPNGRTLHMAAVCWPDERPTISC